MKIVNPEAKIMSRLGKTDYEFVERIGRICYKSEDAITPDSSVKFVKGLKARNHWAMLEHCILRFEMDYDLFIDLASEMIKQTDKRDVECIKYLRITGNAKHVILSGSFRGFYDYLKLVVDFPNRSMSPHVGNIIYELVEHYPELFEEFKLDDFYVTVLNETKKRYKGDKHLPTLITPRQFEQMVEDAMESGCISEQEVLIPHCAYTMIFTCDRGVSHELVRHRPCSFAQESTRYCNYSKDKFDNQISVIKPIFFQEGSKQYELWERAVDTAESAYFDLLLSGAKPQEARSVLPNSLKTEIVVTAYEDEWAHILNLRYHGTTGTPHPQMKEIMDLAVPLLITASHCRLP